MAQPHHQAVVGLGGDLEHVGHGVACDDERVVAGRGERVRAGRANTPTPSWRISDVLPCITVRRAHDLAAVELADALVPEAHAEHGHAALAEVRGSRRSRARRPRAGPGPGEIEHRVGLERAHLVEGDRVVAVHDRLGAELTEVLHEVVDERVVVVDHEHARHGTASTPHRGRMPLAYPAPVTCRPCRSRKSEALPLHAAAAEEGAAEPAVGAGRDVRPCSSPGLLVIVINYLGCCPASSENRYLFARAWC